jgi:subtilisin family serine protease
LQIKAQIRTLLILILLVKTISFTDRVQAKVKNLNYTNLTSQEFADNEIIVEYHKNFNLISSLMGNADIKEQNFFAKLNTDYEIWSETDYQEELSSLRTKIKNYRKNGKLKKLKKAKKIRRTLKNNYAVIKLDHNVDKDKLLKIIRKINFDHFNSDDYEIDAVYPNYIYEITEARTNDPMNLDQFSHDVVEPEALWQYSKGKDTVVAVIDTGVDYNHKDLKANIWVNTKEIPNNGKDDDKNGYIDDVQGWDFVDQAGRSCIFTEDCTKEDNDPSDINGHGTHVAGIIGAVANNNIGISGIAPETKIMALRAGYSSGFGGYLKTSDIMQAVNYALDNGADVINMSFAGYGLDVMSSLMYSAYKKGVICVAAAGNSNSSTPVYPAAISSVIAVGATYDGVSRAYYSNYGSWVDITAPGSSILSTIPNNQYKHKSGTSMAAPIVAGIAALLKAKNKSYNKDAILKLMQDYATETSFYTDATATTMIGSVNANMVFPFEITNVTIPEQTLLNGNTNLKANSSEAAYSYEWTSSKDGILGYDQELNLNNLSLGEHLISVRAQNFQGQWTPEIQKTLLVTEEIISKNNYKFQKKIKIKKRRGKYYAAMSKRTRRQLKAYRWTSNKDGAITRRRGFFAKRLSKGSHILSLEVQDLEGNWTSPLQRIAYNFN